MDESPLGDLSPELRNHIYDLILITNSQLGILLRRAAQFSHLTRTCRQIRSETRELFFANNEFFAVCQSKKSATRISRQLCLIGPETVSQLRYLQILNPGGSLVILGARVVKFEDDGDLTLARGNTTLREWLSDLLEILEEMDLQVKTRGGSSGWYVGLPRDQSEKSPSMSQ